MAECLPPTLDWVAKQIDIHRSSRGAQGDEPLEPGMPCSLATHHWQQIQPHSQDFRIRGRAALSLRGTQDNSFD